MSKGLSVTQARSRFGRIVSRVQRNEDRIVVHRHGNPVVALISLEDLEFLELAEDKFDAREARRRLKEKGVIPWEKIKKDLAL